MFFRGQFFCHFQWVYRLCVPTYSRPFIPLVRVGLFLSIFVWGDGFLRAFFAFCFCGYHVKVFLLSGDCGTIYVELQRVVVVVFFISNVCGDFCRCTYEQVGRVRLKFSFLRLGSVGDFRSLADRLVRVVRPPVDVFTYFVNDGCEFKGVFVAGVYFYRVPNDQWQVRPYEVLSAVPVGVCCDVVAFRLPFRIFNLQVFYVGYDLCFF